MGQQSDDLPQRFKQPWQHAKATFSDETLAMQFFEHPQENFEKVYQRYSVPLYRYILRFSVSKPAAEELLHDVFVELLNNKFSTTSEGTLKSWLYTVAKNKSLNCFAKAKRESVDSKELDAVDSDTNIEEQVIHQNLLVRLSVVEKNLPIEIQQTWALRKQGMDYSQIAGVLAIPIGTVRSRFHRLVDYLRKEFNQNEI